MGWKGVLRSAKAADRRDRQEQDRQNRQIDRIVSKIDRDAQAIRRKAVSLETRVERDIIKALGLSFSEVSGLNANPIQFSNDSFDVQISLLSESDRDEPDADGAFVPQNHVSDVASVTPLRVYLSQWATLIALRIDNTGSDRPLKCSWVRRNDPQASKVYLLDAANSRYYYPLATDLSGDVLKGHPRTGLLAFSALEQPTSELQLHFSGVNLNNVRGRTDRFHFSYTSDSLMEHSAAAHNGQSIVQTVDDYLETEVASLNKRAEKARSGGTSPLAWAVLIVLTILILAFVSN